MGYYPVEGYELMVLVDHHPYIDVRCSLNSLLPSGIEFELSESLVNAELA